MIAYIVQHVHEFDDGEENVKLIGVYSTRERGELAVERSRLLPGFQDAPGGFSIDAYAMDEDHWNDGYVTV